MRDDPGHASDERVENAPAVLYRFRFGSAELDEARFELRVGGLLVELQAKPLGLLALLLGRAGQVVGKDEIVERVWQHPTGDAPIANAVSKLRAALGEANAAAIVTVARQGYRFDGPLERVAVGRRRASRIALAAGQPVPGRESYQLVRLLGTSHANETWLARHPKTSDRRVFKFAVDAERLAGLKREVTLLRVLAESAGAQAGVVRVLDWNFEQPPYWIETDYAGASLEAWAAEPVDGSTTRLAAAPAEERIALLLQAVDAVAAAHGVGVLHKDLKPANLLVEAAAGGGWRVRVTDFGSGRLLDPERLEALRITQLGMTVDSLDSTSGTPFYMAPELGRGEPATARSDVYALGVIAWQLLAGDFKRLPSPGWERDIADPLLREDLALATDVDPERRLPTAAAFAQRLRTLDERRAERTASEAAAARAAQLAEQVARGRARRPWMVAAMAALALGAGVSLVMLQSQRRASQALEHQFAVSQSLNRLLREDLIGAASPAKSGRADITVADALAGAAERIDQRFGGEAPAVRGSLHAAVAQSLSDLSRSKEAVAAGQRAVAALQAGQPVDRVELQNARLRLALDLVQLSSLEPAAQVVAAIERDAPDLGREPAPFQVRLLYVKSWLTAGDFSLKESTLLLERALAIARADAAFDAPLRRVVAFGLADNYAMLGRLDEAEQLLRALHAEQQRDYGPRDARTLYTAVGLGRTLGLAGRADEARALLESAAQGLAAALGPGHRQTLTARSQLAEVAYRAHDYDTAAREWADVQAGFAKLMGEGSSYTVTMQTNQAMALHRGGHPAQAEPLLRAALAHLRAFAKDDMAQVQQVRYALAECLLDEGRPGEVAPLLEGLDPAALNDAQQEPDWPARLAFQRGRLALAQGDRAQARALIGQAADALQPSGTPDRQSAVALLATLR